MDFESLVLFVQKLRKSDWRVPTHQVAEMTTVDGFNGWKKNKEQDHSDVYLWEEETSRTLKNFAQKFFFQFQSQNSEN